MNIGDRKYLIASSGFWIVTPDLHLTLNVWTVNPKTYFLGEPIFIEDSNKLIDRFELGFPNPKIDLLDSTLLENDIDLHFHDLKVEFNRSELFQISKVKIKGLTTNNEKLNIVAATRFKGFEIWKMGNYVETQTDFEERLKTAGVEYQVEDDKENGIIYLKIKT